MGSKEYGMLEKALSKVVALLIIGIIFTIYRYLSPARTKEIKAESEGNSYLWATLILILFAIGFVLFLHYYIW